MPIDTDTITPTSPEEHLCNLRQCPAGVLAALFAPSSRKQFATNNGEMSSATEQALFRHQRHLIPENFM